MPPKLKCNDTVGVHICNFLFVSNSKNIFISHRLAVIAAWKLPRTPYLGAVVLTWNIPIRGHGKMSTKNEVDLLTF